MSARNNKIIWTILAMTLALVILILGIFTNNILVWLLIAPLTLISIARRNLFMSSPKLSEYFGTILCISIPFMFLLYLTTEIAKTMILYLTDWIHISESDWWGARALLLLLLVMFFPIFWNMIESLEDERKSKVKNTDKSISKRTRDLVKSDREALEVELLQADSLRTSVYVDNHI